MRIINAGYEIYTLLDGDYILKTIEGIARRCYKSEDKITDTSAPGMVRNLIKRGHEAMLEHYSFTVIFTVDRGVSHEIVRHRMASYAQESTRYCNYHLDKFGNEITVIAPFFYKEDPQKFDAWRHAMEQAESIYFYLLQTGSTPQEARSVLPNSLKTEICVTMNLREWRHFFKLRACDYTGAAHPQIKEVAVLLLNELKQIIPVVFDDLEVK